MTVMLLQRFGSPHTNQSPKAIINDGLALTSVITSTAGTAGTLAGSASPSVTSLSTPSPTPLPFLFLLESQDSWEEEEEEEEEDEEDEEKLRPGINCEDRASPRDSSRRDSADASRVYAGFALPSADNILIKDTENPRDRIERDDNENDNLIPNNNKNNNNNNWNNNSNNERNNYKNRRNSWYRANVVIPCEASTQRERNRENACREQGTRHLEGWTAGGEAPGTSGARNLGGVRDCGVAATAAIAAGSGSATGGAAGAPIGVAGNGAARPGGHTSSGQQPSENSAYPADSRYGGAGGGAVCGPPVTNAEASTCGPVAGLTRLESQGVAMRYYRLWIYACNIVLLGSALGFAAAVSRTLVFTGDPRRYLVPGVPRALDPTALYAYLALATQLGLVQLLGCIAARRLSAKLLNAYWMLLLALLFGDAVIGVAWVFRFGRMRAELRPSLRLRLQLEYGKDNRFSEHWDRLQRDFSCCGIAGREDFEAISLQSLPRTCCPPNHNLPNNDNYPSNGTDEIDDTCQQPYLRGCEDSLVDWLRKTADLLFVLGICVIAFAKLCFLGILRYEIREMIQKIRLLREPPLPPPSAIMGGSSSVLCTSPPFVQSFSQLGVSPVVDSILTTNPNSTHINNNNNNTSSNNNNNNAGVGAGPRRTTLPMAALPSGNSSTLQQSDDYSGVRHPLLSSNLQDGGADSDTNSHCALILEETTPPSISAHSGCTASTRPDKSNGNNNYEMREFNRRLLLSNGAAGPGNLNATVTRNRRT